jgi:hypothetical protein
VAAGSAVTQSRRTRSTRTGYRRAIVLMVRWMRTGHDGGLSASRPGSGLSETTLIKARIACQKQAGERGCDGRAVMSVGNLFSGVHTLPLVEGYFRDRKGERASGSSTEQIWTGLCEESSSFFPLLPGLQTFASGRFRIRGLAWGNGRRARGAFDLQLRFQDSDADRVRADGAWSLTEHRRARIIT